jgi:hypothetical protein
MVSSTFRETWKPAECLIPVVERELFSLRGKDHSPMRHNLFLVFERDPKMNEYEEWLPASENLKPQKAPLSSWLSVTPILVCPHLATIVRLYNDEACVSHTK